MMHRNAALAAAIAAALGMAGAAQAQTAPGTQAQQINPSPMTPGSRAGDAAGMNPGNNAPGTTAQQANPSAMPPGSRAADAPNMNPAGQAAQGGPDSRFSQGAINPQGTAATTIPGVGNVTTSTGTSGGVVQNPGAGGMTQTQMQGQPQTQSSGMNAGGAVTGNTPVNPLPLGTGQVTGQSTGQPAPGGAGSAPMGGTGAASPAASGIGGGNTPPAVTGQHTQPRTAAAPVPGANSFTEGQARARMGDAGFADVQGLRLDDQGIWRGQAMRDGRQTGVALDFQGNVVATP